MRLTPSLSPDTVLTFESERALPGGSVGTSTPSASVRAPCRRAMRA